MDVILGTQCRDSTRTNARISYESPCCSFKRRLSLRYHGRFPEKKESFFFRLLSAILVPRLRHSPMYRARNRAGDLECALRIWPTLLLPSRPLAQPICFSTANNRLRIYLPTSLKTLKSPYLEGNQTGLPSRKKTRKKISGDILNPRDNSVAAAYKFATAAL